MNIFDKLRNEYPTLSKGRKRIARYILEHKDDAAFISAAELAKNADISETMVVRFSSYLGYARYSDMQQDLRHEAKKVMHVVERMNSFAPTEDSTEGVCRTILDQELSNIDATCANIDLAAFDDIAERIIAANHVGFTAIRAGLSVAVIMNLFINQLLDNAHLLNPGYLDALDRMKTWDENDVVFAVLVYRESNYIETVLQFAKDRGCHIVVITDSLANTVSRFADHVILTKVDGALITMTATMVIANILMNLVLKKLKGKDPDAFRAQMRDFEQIIERSKEL